MLTIDMQAMKKYLDHGYRIVKPFVNYALGWLSPELLGSGFHIKSTRNNQIIGFIPYSKLNCDSLAQLHLGLVTNSAHELVRQMLIRHLGHSFFTVQELKVNISKKGLWNKSLTLTLDMDEVIFDQFCIDLQKENVAPLNLDVKIQSSANSKDKIQFELVIKSQKLLA